MILFDGAENTTNGANEFMIVYREVYGNNNRVFCRNRNEFYKKFTRFRGDV